MNLNESIVEDAALGWFRELGYAIGHGPHLERGAPVASASAPGADLTAVFNPELSCP